MIGMLVKYLTFSDEMKAKIGRNFAADIVNVQFSYVRINRPNLTGDKTKPLAVDINYLCIGKYKKLSTSHSAFKHFNIDSRRVALGFQL
jgi:hypothetical protein